MSDIKHISRKELTSIEVLDILADGGRVVIELSVLGRATKVVIRQHGGTYYCDTPMKLMKYESEEELQDCLERFRLTKQRTDTDVDLATSTA